MRSHLRTKSVRDWYDTWLESKKFEEELQVADDEDSDLELLGDESAEENPAELEGGRETIISSHQGYHLYCMN